jgi:histone deacetylase 1/2
MDNANSKEYLEKILTQVLENLKRTAHAPSVQMTDVPRESLGMNDEDEAALDDLDEDQNADSRMSQRKADKYVEKDGELSDSDDEAMEDMNGHTGSRKRRIMVNYRHIMDVGGNDSGMETGSGVETPQQGSSLPDDADEMNVDELDEEINLIPSPSAADMIGSAAVSGPHSPSAPAADDDIEMREADAEGSAPTSAADALPAEEESTITVQPQAQAQAQQQQTPPESPPAQEAEQPAMTSGDTAPTATEEEAAPVDPAAVTVTATATTEPEATGASIEEAAIKQEVTGDDEVAKAQEEGRMEREVVNAEGEARTEAAARAETDDRAEDEL